MAKKEKSQSTASISSDSSRATETDMMEQYWQIKEQYKDELLFYRFGDFYEMFFDDAAVAARELDIVLTARPHGKGSEKVPMCGVPHSRLEPYLTRLVEKGYKVAVCEQLEGPQKGKGIIPRDVVRVVTPGTLFESESQERMLVALFSEKEAIGVASLDLATAEFLVAETNPTDLPNLLGKLQPQEIVCPHGEPLENNWNRKTCLTECSADAFGFERARQLLSKQFGRKRIDPLVFSHRRALCAAGALFAYAQETQRAFLPHVRAPEPYQYETFVVLDPQTQRNLELVENLFDGSPAGPSDGPFDGTLLAVLDHTTTRMGKRRLRHWVLHPLRSVDAIQQRQTVVAELGQRHDVRREIRAALSGMPDLERLTSRITSAIANPRDLAVLKSALVALPPLHAVLRSASSPLLKTYYDDIDLLDDVVAEIGQILVDEPKALAKEGGLIREGVSAELDVLLAIQADGTGWLADYERQERERTQIANLKVGFNRVFGYYLEVTKAALKRVPKNYTRRQTLVNAERFVTDALRGFEAKVLSATDRGNQLEYELFARLRDQVAAQAERLRQTAAILGAIDALVCLAELAIKKGWVRPEVTETYDLSIQEGRHPVIEARETQFVPNDLSLDANQHLLILTGPNAAGKSTYARQSALLVLLAQMGSFIPAQAATIGVVDRIFTRVGATDFLAQGLSTFMVEMMETANILKHATERSLVILDEVGRGTGTTDGRAIAQAVAERLATQVQVKTLFTTHYHELAQLAETLPGVINARLDVREKQDEVTFLYKVVPGAAQKSYGLYVAKLAGIPPDVVERAKTLLAGFEQEKEPARPARPAHPAGDPSFPSTTPSAAQTGQPIGQVVLDRLAQIDPLRTTPIDALLLVSELKQLAEGSEEE